MHQSTQLSRWAVVVLMLVSIGWIGESTHAEQRVAQTSIDVDATIEEAWALFTSDAGLQSWMTPNATIDLRIGGTLRLSLRGDSTLDDEHTMVHRILSYEPQRMVSMQMVQLPEDYPWAEVFKSVWSVTTFEPLGPTRTRIVMKSLGWESGGVWDDAYEQTVQAMRRQAMQIRGMTSGGSDAMELSREESFQILGRFITDRGSRWSTRATMPNGDIKRTLDEFEWGANGLILKQKSYSVDDDVPVLRYEIIYHWDAERQRVVYTNHATDGSLDRGEVFFVDGDTVVYPPSDAALGDASGVASRIRQTVRFTGADAFDWSVYRGEKGQWLQLFNGPGERIAD